MTTEIPDVSSLDLASYIRPGDLVVWGQGCAEPLTLTEALAAQRSRLGGVRCFTGVSSSAAVRPENCDYLTFISYSGAAANRALAAAGALSILPSHYSDLPRLLSSGPLAADVLFLSLPPPAPDGSFGLGAGADYAATLIGRVRTVIAEVNEQMPDVAGDRRLRRGEIDVLVPVSRQPAIRSRRAAAPRTRSPGTSRHWSRTARRFSSASAPSRRRWPAACAGIAISASTRASSPMPSPS